MHIRRHATDQVVSQAAYSECDAYRYWLKRVWDPAGKLVNFVMLNPSVADEMRNDPTVERCERRARRMGFGAFCVTNIFAWRATDPRAMRSTAHPNGPLNDASVLKAARDADQVIAAWGVHGGHHHRGPDVAAMLRGAGIPLFHLGLTLHGHPRHPLYVAYAQAPQVWSAF